MTHRTLHPVASHVVEMDSATTPTMGFEAMKDVGLTKLDDRVTGSTRVFRSLVQAIDEYSSHSAPPDWC